MAQTYNYHIYHATGFYIVTVQAHSDATFQQMLNASHIPEIKPYTFLQVFTEDNLQSTYPDISKRLPIYPEPPKKI